MREGSTAMAVVKAEDMTAEQRLAAERRRELVQKIADLFAEEDATMDEALGALVDVLGSTIGHGYRAAERTDTEG
jgi:predicted nucleotidyltransferase component of viral defense system